MKAHLLVGDAEIAVRRRIGVLRRGRAWPPGALGRQRGTRPAAAGSAPVRPRRRRAPPPLGQQRMAREALLELDQHRPRLVVQRLLRRRSRAARARWPARRRWPSARARARRRGARADAPPRRRRDRAPAPARRPRARRHRRPHGAARPAWPARPRPRACVPIWTRTPASRSRASRCSGSSAKIRRR